MGGVKVSARAGVHPDPGPLRFAEAVKHPVVQGDELIEDAAARVQLQRQAALGEVHLHHVSAGLQTAADIGFRRVRQVIEEFLARVGGQAVRRVQQAQRRRGDDRLLDARTRMALRGTQEFAGEHPVPERTRGQHRQPPLVPVGERDHHAVGCQPAEAGDGIRGKARLGLLAVGDDRRTRLLHAPDRVRDGTILGGKELGIGQFAGIV